MRRVNQTFVATAYTTCVDDSSCSTATFIDLLRAIGRAHHDSNVKSSEAAVIPLVDQLPRIYGVVDQSSHPLDVPLQGCLDQPLHGAVWGGGGDVGMFDGWLGKRAAAYLKPRPCIPRMEGPHITRGLQL